MNHYLQIISYLISYEKKSTTLCVAGTIIK